MKAQAIVVVGVMLVLAAASLPAQPIITTQPTNQTVMAGGTVTFSVAVSGTGPFIYQWQWNGTNLPNNIISTVAGGGVGDSGAATNATLLGPDGVAMDSSGNLFIVDYYNSRIRKVSTNGIITTVAGNGSFGCSGDGGSAINATLAGPSGIAIDTAGDLFIADTYNQRIRKVSTNGIITTVAGNGSFGCSGDGGSATNASLSHPWGVAVDASGNLFIADSYNNRIRKVSANGIITTVAGGGQGCYDCAATNAYFYNPIGVAVDAAGNLFIADTGDHVVCRVSTDGIIRVVAGNGGSGYSSDGGAATEASVSYPCGVALDSSGNLFIAETGQYRIRKVNTNGIITTVAGNGSSGYSGDGGAATNASLCNVDPWGTVALDSSGNLFIGDFGNSRIRKVSTDGIIITVVGGGIGDGGAATNGFLNGSIGAAVDAAGNLFIADGGNDRIREVSTNGIITTVAGNGSAGYSGDGGAANNASLDDPSGLAVDVAGNLLIADTFNDRIRKVSTNGIITTVAGGGGAGDGGSATNASLSHPGGVAVDAAGNLFIADTDNSRIRKVNTNGIITTVAGNGSSGYSGDGGAATNASLYYPGGVAVDAAGNLFIADFGNDRVRKVSDDGIITTLAGNGIQGCSGDGGVATNASLCEPRAVILDASGNLFIADFGNYRIRKVALAGSPTLTLNSVTTNNAGNYTVVITSPSGSVTSSVATLTVTVAVAPNIQSFWQTNGVFNFTWITVSSLTYQVQYTTNLASTNWTNFGTPVTATNGTASASDFIMPDEERFYRLELLLSP